MSYTCYCTYTFLFWSLVVCCCLCAFCKLYPTKCTYGHLGVIETHWKVGVNQSLYDCISLALIPAVDGAESRQRALDDVRGGGAYLTLRQANALIAEQLNGGRGDGDGGDIGSESSCDLNRGWWEMCQCCRSNTANWSKNQSIDHLRAYGSIAEDVDSIDEQQTVWCSQKLKRKGWDSTQELAWQPVQHTHTHTCVNIQSLCFCQAWRPWFAVIRTWWGWRTGSGCTAVWYSISLHWTGWLRCCWAAQGSPGSPRTRRSTQ